MFKAAFSFYGAKSKILAFYPSPKHDMIIEPFAGGASYSLRHGAGREVWINDLDPKVFAMWTFIRDDLPAWLDRIPARVAVGERVSGLLHEMPLGLVSLLQSEANQGTQGAKGVHDQVTSMGAKCWPRIKDKLAWAHERCQGWIITNLAYNYIHAEAVGARAGAATWFIDPPYDNTAGRRYRQQVVDYNALRDFCLTRRGQVIVCENMGAGWLPFQPVVNRRGIRSRYQKSTAQEGIWVGEL